MVSRNQGTQKLLAGIGAALGLMAFATGAAVAEDFTRTYEFQNVYGVKVRCIVSSRNGAQERQIATIYSSGFEVDRAPTPQAWASSGCAEYVASRSRVVSSEEQQRRFDAARAPLRYHGPGGLREQMVELMCADPKNAASQECAKR